MKKTLTKKILRLLGYTLILALMFLLFKVFLPRNYNAPQVQIRESTKYWDLTTGSRIGYTLISAKGEKRPYPIIYLHGGPAGPIYDEHIKALTPLSEEGYDVYLYDQVGCGQSNLLDNIEEYTADRHKKDLEEIIKKISAKKVVLIGQSWGAILATLFVADDPEKIEKIILTGPGPIMPKKMELADLTAPDSLYLKEPLVSNQDGFRIVQNIRSAAMAHWATIFGCKLASDKEANGFFWTLTNQTNKAMVCDTTKALRAAAGMGYYCWLMTGNSLENVEDPRPKIKNSGVPLLILKGQCDNQKWGFLPEYLEYFTNAEIVIIPNAGHSIWIEQHDLYLKTIRTFLAK
ncbi:MAG: alpha/beta hydrolase [Bacteroidia bacterium]|nr:alpha/beta hydrolase [Bacteroidia bacterium]